MYIHKTIYPVRIAFRVSVYLSPGCAHPHSPAPTAWSEHLEGLCIGSQWPWTTSTVQIIRRHSFSCSCTRQYNLCPSPSTMAHAQFVYSMQNWIIYRLLPNCKLIARRTSCMWIHAEEWLPSDCYENEVPVDCYCLLSSFELHYTAPTISSEPAIQSRKYCADVSFKRRELNSHWYLPLARDTARCKVRDQARYMFIAKRTDSWWIDFSSMCQLLSVLWTKRGHHIRSWPNYWGKFRCCRVWNIFVLSVRRQWNVCKAGCCNYNVSTTTARSTTKASSTFLSYFLMWHLLITADHSTLTLEIHL